MARPLRRHHFGERVTAERGVCILLDLYGYLNDFREGKVMHVTLVHIRVKPDQIEAFIAASRANHEGSVREPGNRRFDVLQDPQDPTCFVLYEAYVGAEDAAAHKTTPHYAQWRDTVAEMMAEPRRGVPYHGLFPQS